VTYAPAIAPSRSRRTAVRFDVVLLGASVLLALTGVVMIYSATRGKLSLAGEDPHYYLKRQAAYVVIGVVVMVALALFDYRRLEQVSTILYVGTLFALLAVLSPIGSPALGSARWFSFGPLQLQPSEFATLVLVVAIAT
jgi:rod shape determining protein RodA